MITLFRRIREKLIASGSVSKYLLYAFGEIMLVVIGILIALQVNNWNGDKQARAFERTLLLELQKAIQNDIEYIEGYLINLRTVRIEEAQYYFYRKILEQEVDPDSMHMNFMWLRFTSQFQYNRGPYESIKSAGIDRIQNDSLRNSITMVYDFEIPRGVELIEWMYEQHEEVVKKHIPYLVKDPQVVIENGKVFIEKPMADIDITKNKHFLKLLDQSARTSEWTKNQFNDVVDELKMLDRMITQIIRNE